MRPDEVIRLRLTATESRVKPPEAAPKEAPRQSASCNGTRSHPGADRPVCAQVLPTSRLRVSPETFRSLGQLLRTRLPERGVPEWHKLGGTG